MFFISHSVAVRSSRSRVVVALVAGIAFGREPLVALGARELGGGARPEDHRLAEAGAALCDAVPQVLRREADGVAGAQRHARRLAVHAAEIVRKRLPKIFVVGIAVAAAAIASALTWFCWAYWANREVPEQALMSGLFQGGVNLLTTAFGSALLEWIEADLKLFLKKNNILIHI